MDPSVAAVQGALQANLPFGYFSTIRCQFVRSGAGPFTWTLAAGDRRAFQYAIGGVATSAGFDGAFVATGAQTNIQDPGRTLQQQTVEIGGLCCRFAAGPGADPVLAALVSNNTWLEISLDGQLSRQIGTIPDFPGA